MCEQELTSNSTSQQVEEVRVPAISVGLQISKALGEHSMWVPATGDTSEIWGQLVDRLSKAS